MEPGGLVSVVPRFADLHGSLVENGAHVERDVRLARLGLARDKSQPSSFKLGDVAKVKR